MVAETSPEKIESHVASGPGLTTAEAARRRQQYGPNMTPAERRRPLRALLGKLWAPVPWMLEVTILLELLLGHDTEAAIIAALVVVNAILGVIQEGRAQNALELLRQRLTIQVRVLRDGHWQLRPAQDLVPGDVVHLRMGDLVPADLRIESGQVLVDQSTLTGESVPVEAGSGQMAHAGTQVKRGEATGEVTATGTRTTFGKTAELVRLAKTGSHLETIIFRIVTALIILDATLVVAVLVYALAAAIPLGEILPFALILLVASVPVALPATFTVATALGALELARQGVLVTRLSAIEEAAGMDVLCSDKTGTITRNELEVAALHCYAPCSEEELLRWAVAASDESTQDPLDLAILIAARRHGIPAAAAGRTGFIPFDPATKRSEGFLQTEGRTIRVVKGAPQVVQALCPAAADGVDQDIQRLAAEGSRILAVAAGAENDLRLSGLIALRDPPREDSERLVRSLHELGIRVLMVTGDGPATARVIARQVGIGDRVCGRETVQGDVTTQIRQCDVFAGALPEDKFRLVRDLQQAGRTVGMTGDGVNDAPALKQAEVGIAVANATDVAKAAASLVLTSPGLANVVAAVETSRRIYQRMLTYTLNKIIKTFEIGLLLSVGLMLTGVFVTTPKLIVLLLFTNDFVTMSIATDRVGFARTPDRWRIRPLIFTAMVLALLVLILSFGIFFWARDRLRLPLPQLQTLIFVMLVFSGQATVYMVRERRHFCSSRPSHWLLASSLLDVLIVSLMATQGILMAPIGAGLVGSVLGLVLLYLVLVDYLKLGLIRLLGLR
jgi:H+-transporting ATPase